ncbi:hypothetical protein GCM10027290_22970 [Micromonospora sonneratiae]
MYSGDYEPVPRIPVPPTRRMDNEPEPEPATEAVPAEEEMAPTPATRRTFNRRSV